MCEFEVVPFSEGFDVFVAVYLVGGVWFWIVQGSGGYSWEGFLEVGEEGDLVGHGGVGMDAGSEDGGFVEE